MTYIFKPIFLAVAGLALCCLPREASALERSWPTTPTLDDNRDRLEQVFASPSAEVPTAVYWYWLSGNVTPEGVADDVRSMKQAGITRAYIGFQGLDEGQAERGDVLIQSPEWYECLRSAMRTATEEGVEIGVFNCPGWSQSGGPWVKPEHSQRYLGTVTCEVSGDSRNIVLPHPDGMLSDVKVLAYRKLHHERISVTGDSACKRVISVTPSKKDFTLRSVTLKTASPVKGTVRVKALQGGVWNEVGDFDVDRTNMMIDVGYDVLAPTAAGFAETKGDAFMVELDVNDDCRVSELIVSEEPVVSGYADRTLSKLFQSPLPYWHDYKWESSPACSPDAVLGKDDVVDVTRYMSGDSLVGWTVPAGDWIIARTYMAPTGIVNGPALEGDGKGLEIDRWSAEALNNHYDSFIGEILAHVPAHERRTWKYIVSDSYERGSQNFGDDFIEYFKSYFGYDPTPYLLTFSGVVVESVDHTERFLWDLRRMVADRLAYDHIGALRDRANRDGFKLWLEPYGHWGFPGEFLMYGGQSDEVGGEFWSEGNLGDIENRAASSVAHTYGKGICWSESFTCGLNEFGRSPRTMKQRGDRFFTEGVNASLLHLMVSQPDSERFPGTNCPFGNDFNRKNTWYSHLDLFTDYLKRVGYMLRQGNYVADVAYFIGEDTPVMTGVTDPELPAGYQYDFINAEVIEKSLRVDSTHRLTLPHGTSYRLLVLPPMRTMRPELLRRIKNLVADGAVVLGPKPLRSPSLQNYEVADAEVREMADELWGLEDDPAPSVRTYGNGLIITGLDMPAVLGLLETGADFSHTAGEDADIKYAHVSSPQRDIYFVANQMGKPCDFTASFRDAAGRQPELWNPVDGSHRDLQSSVTVNGRVALPLRLDAMESAIIVFEREKNEAVCSEMNYPEATDSIVVSTPWTVNFKPMVGKSKRIKLSKLTDLSTSTDDYVKHFSGTAIYTTTIKIDHLPDARHVDLDLGEVREMARVKVNGVYVGGVWTAPYTVDITGLLRHGKNTIEIEVVNTWVNRLVGDSKLPENERTTWCFFKTHGPDTPLQSAGLLNQLIINFF